MIIEILKAILFGVVEGITEWLPISSTGHMILLDEFVKLNLSSSFKDTFLIVVQLGAILAVVALYWRTLLPFKVKDARVSLHKPTFVLWAKILVACLPAAIVGLLWDKQIEERFYNYQTVALALIIFGIAFIVVESRRQKVRVDSLEAITFKAAFVIGLFQLIAAVFPGTSRSGATILGGIMLGLSRSVAAEFTFFLAVPVMFGASLLKLMKAGTSFSTTEWTVLAVGMVTAFLVSIVAIKYLMRFIKNNDFKPFGWYRIALGSLVLIYFMLIAS